MNAVNLMQMALSEAVKCTVDVPVGALILDESNGFRIISTSFNQREILNDPLGHAELLALRSAAQALGQWRLQGLTLVCTLEPCPMCAEAIIQSRIKKVIFGAFDPVSGAAGSAFNLFAQRKNLPVPEVIGGILEKECALVLTDFFAAKRK
jgi:tRNA(adenine34) deaminase